VVAEVSSLLEDAVAMGVAVVDEVEANVLRRWVARGEGVGEVRGGSSRRRER
jgi:hypothetical protein